MGSTPPSGLAGRKLFDPEPQGWIRMRQVRRCVRRIGPDDRIRVLQGNREYLGCHTIREQLGIHCSLAAPRPVGITEKRAQHFSDDILLLALLHQRDRDGPRSLPLVRITRNVRGDTCPGGRIRVQHYLQGVLALGGGDRAIEREPPEHLGAAPSSG